MTTLLALVATLAALHFARDLLIPLVLAVLVSFALSRPVSGMERLGFGRRWAVGLVVGALMLVMTCTGWVVVTQMKHVIDELPGHRTVIQQKLSDLTSHMAALKAAGQALVTDRDAVAGSGASAAETATSPQAPGASPTQPLYVSPIDASPTLLRQMPSAIGSLMSPVGTAGMVILLALFMLINREDLRNRFIRLISNGDITGTTQALTEACKGIGRYLGMQTIINGSFGLAVALSLYLLGVPGWALWGFLCSLLRFLPYVGILLGAMMPVAMALAAAPGWGLFFATVGVFVVLEATTNLVLEPWLYGESAGVSPFAVLIAAAVWAWLWGPIGLLLAMPLTVVAVVMAKVIPQLGFLNVMLGTDEALSPADRFYQRMMANDPREAIKILQEKALGTSLVDAYETVLVPGLIATERDWAAGRLTAEGYATLCDDIRDSLEEMEASKEPHEDAAAAVMPADSQTPGEPRGIICVPVKTGTNDVAADLICRMLQRAGHRCRVASVDHTLSEQLEHIDADDTVCIVSLSDPTLRYVRAICKRMHSRQPGLHIVVMAWGATAEVSTWRYRSLAGSTNALATNAAELLVAVARQQQAKAGAHALATIPAVPPVHELSAAGTKLPAGAPEAIA